MVSHYFQLLPKVMCDLLNCFHYKTEHCETSNILFCSNNCLFIISRSLLIYHLRSIPEHLFTYFLFLILYSPFPLSESLLVSLIVLVLLCRSFPTCYLTKEVFCFCFDVRLTFMFVLRLCLTIILFKYHLEGFL